MNTPTIDAAKAAAFAAKMMGLLNNSMLGLLVSIGHQTGLFDAMGKLPASTSRKIAKAAKLNERYVREWLGGMVTGGIVDYDARAQTFHLAPEHATFLTRSAGQYNFAFFSSYIAVLADACVLCLQKVDRAAPARACCSEAHPQRTKPDQAISGFHLGTFRRGAECQNCLPCVVRV